MYSILPTVRQSWGQTAHLDILYFEKLSQAKKFRIGDFFVSFGLKDCISITIEEQEATFQKAT